MEAYDVAGGNTFIHMYYSIGNDQFLHETSWVGLNPKRDDFYFWRF